MTHLSSYYLLSMFYVPSIILGDCNTLMLFKVEVDKRPPNTIPDYSDEKTEVSEFKLLNQIQIVS